MKRRYSRQGLWTLFLICALLPHLWALVLIARDMSWAAERTNAWDAIGVASYGLLFTLVESLLIFAVICLLGLLTPRAWSIERRTAFLSALVLSGLFWAVMGQLGFLLNFSPSGAVLGLLARSEHPVRWMYMLAAALVLPTTLIPALWITRSERALRIARQVTERLSLLAVFYLVFDALGILVLLIRNIG